MAKLKRKSNRYKRKSNAVSNSATNVSNSATNVSNSSKAIYHSAKLVYVEPPYAVSNIFMDLVGILLIINKIIYYYNRDTDENPDKSTIYHNILKSVFIIFLVGGASGIDYFRYGIIRPFRSLFSLLFMLFIFVTI